MLFLKKLEAFGFKSFAEPLSINFEHEMIGIVGPNGSGKSNINDAIRWCLGEQSMKSLRGNSVEDVIFNGSGSKPPLNMAEVKVTFDNSHRFFDLDYDEIEVTRRTFRGSGENEYFINKQRVRLKDVQDFAMDSGITKSSLAIISQGNVNSFAEAKPLERRALFEEAAGVAKYKKRKLESLKKLERSNENLARIKDIINEIERKLPSLKRQSEKALKYKAKKDKLNEIELAILVKDVTFFNQKLSELKEQQKVITFEKQEAEREITLKENEYNSLSKENYSLDNKITSLSKQFQVLVNEISDLKVQKIELDNKENALKMSNSDITVSNMLHDFNELKIALDNEQEKLALLNNQQTENKAIRNNYLKEQTKYSEELGALNKTIFRLENDLDRLQRSFENNDNLHEGVRNIINNKNVLPGIIGLVQELITVDTQYEQAIGIALSGRLQDIVVKNVDSAKKAIGYLKQNKAGHATFIPLDIITPRYLRDDEEFIIQSVKGYLGIAHKLVKTSKEYQPAIDYLLSRYLVSQNFDSAQEVAKLISYKYNVLTLEGELIRPQGAISGGNRKTKQILINPEKEVETLKHQINEKLKKYDELNQTLNQLNNKLDEINEIINENQSSIGASKRQIEILDQDKSKLKNEYQLLTSKNIDENEVVESKNVVGILDQINHKEILKTEVEQQLNVARSLKEKQLTHLNELNNVISEKRHYTAVLLEKVGKLNTDITMLNSKIQQDLSRLTEEYHMTYDHAKTLELKSIENEDEIREEIKELRSELATIGNVNLDAIQEYQEEYERYSFMKNEYDDINNAVKNLLTSIDEMDSLMEDQFDKTIKEVNQALPSTFEVLFGGGTAKIIYTEPDNILETGIDIKISPPGKNINNLNLLSGGEKSLVALSVLFAILKVRPIPLVILDEAEAPLDPANVERFAKYIRTFVNTTQFIIVTHRLGTMEHCDVLYGATMQQKGVTKIVGIKLKQAEEMIAQIKNKKT
ncbi:chromosome segregation protein SMC [Spiroplasma eriocheiris]|uniref:Chromosome partition protein Smc n=1 Tax=Spiroplasma eriocheiris TaxID=315358 RepID=A0A0H3XKW2_9MOLU|nr:chromosome segregation protein SMC [Spiroplasma eriocheiris]AHF58149.1 SMC superfamily protein [Spiroplasma eriocheiris CCTCC M 207170]AKM54586.1 chromosome condensation and segregation SMC ATPase [Spiroplasma eriocheiris]